MIFVKSIRFALTEMYKCIYVEINKNYFTGISFNQTNELLKELAWIKILTLVYVVDNVLSGWTISFKKGRAFKLFNVRDWIRSTKTTTKSINLENWNTISTNHRPLRCTCLLQNREIIMWTKKISRNISSQNQQLNH